MAVVFNHEDKPKINRSIKVYKHMKDSAILRNYYKMKNFYMNDISDISGSSPTDIFIGKYGYPKVSVGPMIPPEFGNTSLLGTPELWGNMSIKNIVNMRLKLVRGIFITNVWDVEKNRITEHIRDLALSERPVDSEIEFSDKLNMKFDLKDNIEPFGPSVKMSKFELGNIKANKKIESRYNDTDATATTSMIELYEKGIPISKINKGLSAGLFGIAKKRVFVPTKWSITAVDDTLSKYKRELIKEYDKIDHIQLYYGIFLDTRWMVIFMQGEWSYEVVEAWYKIVWNEDPNQISIYSSDEGYRGRSKYAEIGGSYYAARLAVTEKLNRINKQAKVLILREVHEGYSIPVGVWNVREHVRMVLDKEPIILEENEDILKKVAEYFDITPKEWIKNSNTLKYLFLQKTIMGYIK